MTSPVLAALGLAQPRAAAVLDALRARGETLATAESLTAGLVCAALTCVPGASAVVRGGLVVYATDLKAALAGVSEQLLAEHGAVHPQVAEELASGARARCAASWGLGLTGVAGPDPQDGISPGRVYLALSGTSETHHRTLDLTGDRDTIRAGAVIAAVDLLAATVITDLGENR